MNNTKQRKKTKAQQEENRLLHANRFNIPIEFKINELEKIKENKERRANLKINRLPYPAEHYKNCYINSEEYKNRHKK